ncbi:MAG: hypothetical protein ACRDBG_01890 [Waterburya sp.]
MAKNTESTEVPTEAPATTPAAAEAPKADARIRMFTDSQGKEWARKDYIKHRWAQKASRSQIAKELGVPYQIVFQGTKGVPGGPDPVAPVATEAPAEPVAA